MMSRETNAHKYFSQADDFHWLCQKTGFQPILLVYSTMITQRLWSDRKAGEKNQLKNWMSNRNWGKDAANKHRYQFGLSGPRTAALSSKTLCDIDRLFTLPELQFLWSKKGLRLVARKTNKLMCVKNLIQYLTHGRLSRNVCWCCPEMGSKQKQRRSSDPVSKPFL